MTWQYSSPSFESDKLNSKLKFSPWDGHRNFIYDLLPFINPTTILELGVHYGCSFFAMAQSIKNHQLSTQLIGIDTFKGDEHCGHYGDEVLQKVQKTIDQYFPKQNLELQVNNFTDALSKLPDNLADLIHIDGYHTHQALTEDFNNAFSKLKENGLILFHDTNPDKDYGSKQFWHEIKEKYPHNHFEFEHSWGLGILAPKGSQKIDQIKQHLPHLKEYYQFKYHDQLFHFQKDLLEDRDSSILAQKKMIEDRDACINSQEKMIDERDQYIKTLEATVEDRTTSLNRIKQKKLIKVLKKIKYLP